MSKIKRRPKNYWTIETCRAEAIKYSTRKEFNINCPSAYRKSSNEGWIDEICSHMRRLGNLKNRCVYAYEFGDNFVYVGLTFDYEGRWNRRLLDKEDPVKMHIDKTGTIPERKMLTDYIEETKAVEMEIFYINKYRNDGWNLLNIAKGGSLGGNIPIWDKDKCREESKKYKKISDFKKINRPCLAAIYRNKWNDLLSHLPKNNNKIVWDRSKCEDEAKKYSTRTEFFKKSRSAYGYALRNNLLNDLY
jgi:hypothetical protein